ncbi:ASCH domain-containing protein [Ectobacillus ponti]|uniref:ASCH domain-containing protein n=1 Tax=Ectobacillus ponti TaxID=2961894 RepID=A0AA42BNW8_9BACI|nr:ASCH domain-containing protein [Ectobacillus ponti]MCP8968440.1 ASCH domain-containing protein [Ectobacillus ponti]
MVHNMGLYGEYFHAIRQRKKLYEVRLYDEKRRAISVGDTIEFLEVPEGSQLLRVKVLGLRRYDTFREMYEDIPFALFDCEDWTMEEMVQGTYDIYSPEQERQWGALAIRIEPVAEN